LIAGLHLGGPARSFRHELVAHRDGRPAGDDKSRPGAAGENGGDVVARLGGAAGAGVRYPESLRYFARGYRYSRGIERPAVTAAPVGAGAVSRAPGENPLEAYFDSHSEGHGIWKWRHYFDIYDRHLARFRGRPVRMVEIGVFGGGSLPMWREYFGADTHIYGIDIDESCRELAGPGVEIFIGDQSDRAFWRDFLAREPQIDVVLDDGGHTPNQQMVTLECLLPAIQPGGVYICEDINGAFQPFHAFVDGLAHPLSAVGFGRERPRSAMQEQIASVHRYPLVTVIEKPGPAPAQFESARRGSDWPADRV
jgi:hypothetical protein